MPRKTWVLALLWAMAPALQAADKGIGIYTDQDLFLPVVNEDRDYTMGLAVEFFDQQPSSLFFDNLLRYLENTFRLNRQHIDVARSYLLGSVNYTPQDLSQSAPIPGDRPYASLVFLANKRAIVHKDSAVAAEIQIGLLGTYLARAVQTALHRHWRDATGDSTPVDPKGWRNQISAGGEPTARLRIAGSHLLPGNSRWFDLAVDAEANIGYQTNAAIGFSARAGWLKSNFASIPFNPINRGNYVPDPHAGEFYLWGAYRARAIAYDALLQGQFRDSALTYGFSDLNHLVHEAGVGVTVTPWKQLQLTLAANMKTAELKSALANRTHWWGGTYLTVAF